MRSFRYQQGLVAAIATCMLVVISGCAAKTDSASVVEDVASSAPDPCAIGQSAVATSPNEAKSLLASSGVAKGGLRSADPSIIQKFANSIAGNVASKAENELEGWALSALGMGQPNIASQLAEIQTELAEITQQLQQIQTQLANITAEIKDATYIGQIGSLTQGPIAKIGSLQESYCNFVATAESDQTELTSWANEVLDASTGIQPQLVSVIAAFNGNEDTQLPSLASMYSTFALDQGQIPVWGDVAGYQNVVNPYTQYFVNLVVLGMNLQVEAQHYLYPNDTAQAVQSVTDTWTSIRSMYQTAGFPASQPDGGGSNAMLVNNLTGAFWTQAPLCYPAPGPCSFNVTVGDDFEPAGWPSGGVFWEAMTNVPVPPGKSATNVANPDYENPSYNGWQVPSQSQVQSLWAAAPSGTTPWQFLKSSGFGVDQIGPENNSQLFADAITDDRVRQYECDLGQLCPYDDDVYIANSVLNLASGKDEVNTTTSATSAGMLAISSLTASWQGYGNYKGMPTRPDTSWLDSAWPASPPSS